MSALPLSAVVLAGGQSRRLGQDKILLRLWGSQGPTLLERVVGLLSAVCDEVLVVSDGPRNWPHLPVRVVFDHYPGGGTLGGIYSGLFSASFPHALAVGCDMPFLNEALLRYMAGLPRDYDVLIPRRPAPDAPNEFFVEPLHAIYGRSCLKAMHQLLERDEHQVIRFFPQVRVRYLEADELARFDPAGLSFRNVNTPQDLEEALEIIRHTE